MTSSWSGPSYGITGAAHVRHFIVHTRRVGHVVARPLGCGVMRDRTTSSVAIRPCVGGDLGEVVPLLQQLWPDKRLHVESLRIVWESAMASRSQAYFCAVDSGRIVGFGSLSWKNNLWQEGLLGHIDELVVDARYRGQGIGARMLDHLTSVASAKGCKRVELDSAHHRSEAHRFYEAHGFRNRAGVFSKAL